MHFHRLFIIILILTVDLMLIWTNDFRYEPIIDGLISIFVQKEGDSTNNHVFIFNHLTIWFY
ncbi:hypothetical protein AM592_05880 [Bacillus gobiensis]|uniref:Uncharacterized protein n=2 Tax=Bacillus TaxID=1386 RepID=A0A0M5J9U0_9BACI|nr:hypothetical protein AM592_05880 [Bacillus gobiensis]MBP1080156.1 hypothetical protein [Bacillus capparidis]